MKILLLKTPKYHPPPPLLPNKENAKPQIIISLTSYPARIHTLKYTLFTLLTQSLKPDKVVLWLAEDEFRNANKQFNPKKLPKSLLDFSVKGLEIMWYETNIKSYKKLIPSLQQFPDSIIVTADDDNLYDKHWLAKLYSAFEANPSYIHCHRARRIAFVRKITSCLIRIGILKYRQKIMHLRF